MVIDPDTRISYSELDAGTAALAAGLLAAGIGKGTRVGLIMPNSVDWVRIALAAHPDRCGAGAAEHTAAPRLSSPHSCVRRRSST